MNRPDPLPNNPDARAPFRTLVVAPMSLVRQWESELKDKVNSSVDLSICVYHGAGRTKNPHVLANYDIVLTTYAILTNESGTESTYTDDGILLKQGRKRGPLFRIRYDLHFFFLIYLI